MGDGGEIEAKRAKARAEDAARRRHPQGVDAGDVAHMAAARNGSAASRGKLGRAVIGLVLLLGGCMSNNVFLELIISPRKNPYADPAAGASMTMLQFVGVAVLSTLTSLEWRAGSWWPSLPPRRVPVLYYGHLVVMFVGMSLLNNWAFALHISQPMHMVFRSAGLVATFFVGKLFFDKEYTTGQLIAVLVLSVGTLISTAAEALVGDTADAAAAAAAADTPCCDDVASPTLDAAGRATEPAATDGAAVSSYFLTWLLGIGVLTAAVTLSAVLSQYQDRVRRRFKPTANEMLRYQHALALPTFLATEPGWCPAVTSSLPVMWFYILGNVVTQFVCVKGVFMLADATGALTMTMALTVRKCLSLFVSIGFFGNKFTQFHFAGAAAVFSGIVIYNLSKAPKQPQLAAKKQQ